MFYEFPAIQLFTVITNHYLTIISSTNLLNHAVSDNLGCLVSGANAAARGMGTRFDTILEPDSS